MEEIVEKAQDVVTPVPLDPQAMTELIQQINDMYSSTFNLYIGLFAITLTLFGVFFTAISAGINRKNKKDISSTNKEITILEDELKAIRIQKSELDSLEDQYKNLETLFNKFKLMTSEQRDIDKKMSFYNEYSKLCDEAWVQAHRDKEPSAAILKYIHISNEALKQIAKNENNQFTELLKENENANEMIWTLVSGSLTSIAEAIPKAREQATSALDIRTVKNWEKELKDFIKGTEENLNIAGFDLLYQVKSVKNSLSINPQIGEDN